MTSQKVAYVLLALVALSSAFSVDDYLYSYEDSPSVTYENFTQNGKQYSIISLDGEDALMLENGKLMNDSSEIDSVLELYYLSQYYPSDDEVDDLMDLLEAYNDSRNDGHKFPDKEEYVCREIIFIDGRVKDGGQPIFCRDESDDENCKKASMLMFQFLSSVSGTPPVSSPSALVDPLKEFGFASYGTDRILDDLDSKFEDAESDRAKMMTALQDTQDAIPDLEDYLEDLEDSQWGWTAQKGCDQNHWCLCPDIDLNDSHLEDIEDQVDDLIDKIGPFDQFAEVSAQIYTQSMDRHHYATVEKKAADHLEDFQELEEDGAAAISLGDEAVSHVSNYSLSLNLSKLRSLHTDIPDDIEDREFNTTEDDIEEYEELIDYVNDVSFLMLQQYNATLDAKHETDSIVVLLEARDLDPVSKESLEVLENHTADLDAEFRDGLTIEELKSLEVEYKSVRDEAQNLLSTETEAPATQVLLLFRGFARNVNTGIAGFAEKTEIIEREEIPQSPVTLGLFSGLVFLSLASIALLVFLYVVATTRFSIPQTSHILASAFFSVLLLLLSFSVFMFLFLGKTSTDATLTEFLTDFESKEETAIAVDLRNASYSDSLAMASCAEDLAKSMGDQNKSWTLYKISGNTCTQETPDANATLDTNECLADMGNASSAFMLGYSDTNEPPKFSVIYTNKAEIKANYDYYESCPLVALFS
jgi:hypothetical protein